MISIYLVIIVGVHAATYAFPKVKLVSTALDEKVNSYYHIMHSRNR